MGWNPLNVNLLTMLPDKKNVVDLIDDPLKPSYGQYLKKGASNHYLDLLIKEGRKWKFEEMKKEQMTSQQKIEPQETYQSIFITIIDCP